MPARNSRARRERRERRGGPDEPGDAHAHDEPAVPTASGASARAIAERLPAASRSIVHGTSAASSAASAAVQISLIPPQST